MSPDRFAEEVPHYPMQETNCSKKENVMKTKFNQSNLKVAIASAALLGAASLTVPAYAATDTSNMAVTATVGEACTIATADIAFGAYDAINDHASAPLTAQGSVTTTCTLDKAAKVIIGQGLYALEGSTDGAPVRRMGGDGEGDYLAYNVYSDASLSNVWTNAVDSGIATTGTGEAVVMQVYGAIEADQTDSPAGSYSDTLVVTVDY